MNHEVGSRRDAAFPNEEEKTQKAAKFFFGKLLLTINMCGNIVKPSKVPL